MTGLGAGFILLFLLLYHTRPCHCNYAEILWGQCYAFCLTQHESRLYSENGGDQGVTVKKCRRDRVCKGCLYACERPRDDYQNQDTCSVHCQKTRPRDNQMGRQACNDSCNFVYRSFTVKYGSCPRVVTSGDSDMGDNGRDRRMSFDDVGGGGCRDQCQRDLDCEHMLKCCTSGCRKMCLRAVEWKHLPPVPKRLRFKTRRDGSTMVEWNKMASELSTKPVLYVLRWWCSYTDGVIATLTTKLKLRLKGYDHQDGLHPGETCQFMLAAVNKFGSQGFSDTQQFTKKFIRPSRPGNLERVRSKLQNGKVAVTIKWQPPIYRDNLPISRFVVLWSDPLPRASPEYERRHMHNKTVDGEKTSFIISGLEPGTVYFVQVRAVVGWKGRSIKGDPVSTYLETYSIPRGVEPVAPDNIGEEAIDDSVVYNITVSKPAFLQSQLKAWVTWDVHSGVEVMKYMIYWVPDVCDGEAEHRKTMDRIEHDATTHKREFLLYNLMSNCVYELRIHAVSSVGEPDSGRRKVFQTEPCVDTQGARPELCRATESPPLSPVDVLLRFKTSSSCMCQAVISWRRAQRQGSGGDSGHEGAMMAGQHYQPLPSGRGGEEVVYNWNIVWGESRQPTGISSGTSGVGGSSLYQATTVVYNTSPYQLTVPGADTNACLTNLENSKHYTVQIIGQSGDTKGDPAVFHFITPDYIPVCYNEFGAFPGKPAGSGGEEATTRDGLELSSEESQTDSIRGNAGNSLYQEGRVQVLIITALTVCCILLCHHR